MKKKFSSMGRVAIALVLALSLFLMTAVPVSAAGLTAVSATPADATETVTTTYTIGFTPVTTLVIDSVEIEFEADFDVSSAALSGTPTGIGAGTVSSALQVVTYALDVPELLEGEAITIALSDIVNPTGARDYEVTVRTMSGVAPIDTGTDDVTITPLPVSFLVVANVGGPDNTVNVGEAFSVTITAKQEADGAGATETGYVGDHFIDFTYGGSPTGTLPDFELISFIEGVGTSSPANFILTDAEESDNTIIATDGVLSVVGTSEAITINPAAFSQFAISGEPVTIEAGVDFDTDDITVTAKNADGEIVTDYTGTVSWTSSDPLAELPDPYTFVAGDNGEKTFDGEDFILKTVGEEGTQTITVTDGTVSKTSAPITVTPADAIEIIVEAEPTSIRADDTNASTITATAYDEFGNVDTEYGGNASFTASLGDIVEGNAGAFTLGETTATLTSNNEVGTATIRVVDDAAILPDVTTTVELLPALLTEVWVDDDGDDANPGTLALPVASIQEGIDIAAVGGTVNVFPGTYTPSGEIDVANGLTLQSTGGAAVTIIDGSLITLNRPVIHIEVHSENVTVEGFSVVDAPADGIWIGYDTEGATVRNNIIRNATWSGLSLNYDEAYSPTWIVTGATVSDNIFTDCATGIDVGGCLKDSTISNNTITGCAGGGRGINFAGGFVATDTGHGGPTEGNTISENTIIANASMGIFVKENTAATGTVFFDDNSIEGNTISGNALAGIEIDAALVITDLTITGNDIIANTEDGILIGSWGATNAINNNNIYGNTVGDFLEINNTTVKSVNAENNWWGVAFESAIVGMVSDLVDYSPWLNAPYPDGFTIVLETGWNFISVPKRMATTTDTFGELLNGIEVEVAYSYDPVSGWSPALTDATPVEVLEGYWIDVNAAGTITLSYKEGAQEVPASKSLVGDAWNAIGFSSTIPLDAYDALMSVDGSWSTVLGWYAEGQVYDNSIIFSATETTGDLFPGKGYWIWMTEDDVLSAISG